MNIAIMPNKLLFYYCFVLFVATACAHKVAPNGGDKDEQAPKISQSVPKIGGTQVSSRSVSITFDEFVQLNKPETELVISPYLAQKPKVKLKGKTLLVEFEQDLAPNTTYTFNFGNSIQDLTEGNTIKDYTFYFSTGNTLDSLQIKGQVLSADKRSPMEGIVVALYPKNAPDSAFRTTPPQYIARTNKNGQFSLNNLPDSSYQLFALKDQNSNYYYDQQNEDLAFLDTSVRSQAPAIAQAHTLLLFNEQLAPPSLQQKNNTEYSRILLQYDKGIDSLQVTLIDSALYKNTRVEILPQQDSILLWYKNLQTDDPISIAVTGKMVHDTIEYVRTIDKKTLSDIGITSNINLGRGAGTLDLGKAAWLQFNHPIEQWNRDSVVLSADGKPVLLPNNWIQQDPKRPRRYYLNYVWKADIAYRLIIPAKTMTDFEGQQNDEIVVNFTTASPQKYGTLNLQLQHAKPNTAYLLQIYRNVNNALTHQQVIRTANSEILYINPDSYTLVLIEDSNNNGKWDAGNWAKKQQSERVFTKTQPTIFKALWTTEVLIDVQ